MGRAITPEQHTAGGQFLLDGFLEQRRDGEMRTPRQRVVGQLHADKIAVELRLPSAGSRQGV
jgi:hypothetical protein